MRNLVDPTIELIRPHLRGYRREIVNMSWLFFDRFLRVFGTFLIGIFAARLLGPADYGGVSYAITVNAFLMLLMALGFNAVVVKILIERPDQASAILGTGFAVQAMATLVIMAATIVSVLSAKVNDSFTMLVAIVASGLVLRPTEIFRYWFEANVNARRAVIADNIAFFVSGSVKVAALFYLRSAEALAWALAFDQLLGGICLILAYRTDGTRPPRWQFDVRIMRQLVTQSWPVLLSGLSVALYMRLDQFIIITMRGPGETGVYAAATRLSEIFYVLPAIVATSYFPRWQALIGKSGAEHLQAVRSAMVVMIALSTLIALALSVGAAQIVAMLYGASYARAAPVLAIHAWTCVFVSMGILGNQWYLSHNLQSRTLLCTILGATSNLTINLLLVPSLGAVGGAIASLVAQTISTFLADIVSPKTRPLFYIKVQSLLWPLIILRLRRGKAIAATEGTSL